MDPATAHSLVGCLLDGRYRVGSQIARGGMATVHQADDLRLQRTVAIKIMHAGFAEDAEFLRRFHREAHAAASLTHPNVVAVFDQGHDEESGAVYLTMEYVPGSTLRDLLAERGQLDPDTALGIMDPVLDALGAAHRAGLIHRDVKPENILLGSDGEVKVADFGLARAITTSTATQGKLIGTVSYLAPEQLVGGRTDTRSDVYSAGVVLYEMLTGYKPHRGDTPIQVAYKHVNEDVASPSERAPGLPRFVDGLVLRSTARDPHVRPADAGVLMHYVRRARTALEQRADDPELTEDLLAFRPASDDSPPADHPAEAAGLDMTDPAVAELLPAVADSEAARNVKGRANRTGSGPARRGENTSIAPAVPLGTIGTPASARPSKPRRSVASRQSSGASSRDRPPDKGSPGKNSGRAAGRTEGRTGSGRNPGKSRSAGSNAGPGRERSSAQDRTSPRERVTRPRLSRRVLRRRRLLATTLAVLLVAGIGLIYWFGFARYTHVPDLRELAGDDLRQSAAAADVRLRVADNRVWHDEIDAGQAARVSPDPGERIRRGQQVEVVLSKGVERHRVPKLAGRNLRNARSAILDRNWELVSEKRVYRNSVPSGQVVGVRPEPGTVLVKGSSVRLVVSRGPAPVEVPSVRGDELDAARGKLEELGLKVQDSDAYSDDIPEGHVVSQKPEPGNVRRGETIELVVSKGPEFRPLPDVSNSDAKDAEKQLRGLGFEVQVEKSDLYVGANLVVGQSPGAGEKVRQGKTVTLEIV